MIYAIDDEQAPLDMVSRALEDEGFEVAAFIRPADALESLAHDAPELIICDVMMPEMNGFELRAAICEHFPRLDAPFVFLSLLSDPEMIVRGLDSGAEDYLTKPVDPRVLRAKVRSLLARGRRESVAVFHGDLARLPFIRVIQFCELHGLTGEASFLSGVHSVTVEFRGGKILTEGKGADDEALARFYDLETGTFVIRSRKVDFGSLHEAAFSNPADGDGSLQPGEGTPMGRLSGIRASGRLFQVQTEMTSFPEAQILTVVVLGGKTVLKRVVSPPPGATRRDLEQLIERHHAAVEAEVREKIQSLATKAVGQGSEGRELFYELLDGGFEAYRRNELEQAVKLWKKARDLNPEDSSLEINLRIANEKLQGLTGGRSS